MIGVLLGKKGTSRRKPTSSQTGASAALRPVRQAPRKEPQPVSSDRRELARQISELCEQVVGSGDVCAGKAQPGGIGGLRKRKATRRLETQQKTSCQVFPRIMPSPMPKKLATRGRDS
jgi:hypothetical protein